MREMRLQESVKNADSTALKNDDENRESFGNETNINRKIKVYIEAEKKTA